MDENYYSYSRNRNAQMNRRNNPAGLLTFDIDDETDEKSWQRVPSFVLLVLLGAYLSVGFLAQLIEDDVPRPILEKEIQKKDANTFSEESAKRFLHQLLGDGPRVAGTEYHLKKTKDLKEILDSIATNANLPVKTDWQFVSDDYWLEFGTPYVNSYRNLSNLIAVMEGESGISDDLIGSSLLINCHYDSVPYAIGASDNGVFCAVMLEALSKLSRSKKKMLHNIIFLFNGAEENPLQGSHGFLKHPWAKGVRSVVNLDAAGMNGKPSVFQVSDNRALDSYKSIAERPSAQSFGEALFKSGFIPSDTDFRIWRDFGDIHGVDMAFTKWGCTYHTRNDRPQLIKHGVIQNAGEVIIGMLLKMAMDPNMGSKVPATSTVYFDYLNLYLFTYSKSEAIIIDCTIALIALLSVVYYLYLVGFRRSSLVSLGWSVGDRLLGGWAGLVTGLLVILLMSLVSEQLRYLSRPWIVVPFYWIPFFIGSMLITIRCDDSGCQQGGMTRSLRTLQAMAATRLLLSAILLPLAFVAEMASVRYVIAVPLGLMAISSFVSTSAVKLFRLKANHQLALEFILSLPPIFFLASLSLRINAIIIPTAGRMPANYPDFVVGGLNLVLAAFAATIVSGIELLFSRKRLWVPIALVAFVCAVFMFVPLKVYEEDGISTQRHSWFHSSVVTIDFEGHEVSRVEGVVVPRQDALTLPRVRALGPWSELDVDCDKLFCDLPLSRPRFATLLNDSLFIKMEPPARFEPEPSLNITKNCNKNDCTLQCIMIGPPHNLITILPMKGVELTKWSFSSPLKSSTQFQDRPVYIIFHSIATYQTEYQPLFFTLTFNVSSDTQNGPIVQISHHAHKIFHPQDFTEEYKKLLEKSPKYFNIASTLSIRTNYVF